MESIEDSPSGRKFSPFRIVRRGLGAACRWTVGFGRRRLGVVSVHRLGRRGRGRKSAPPLASLSAAMLEPGVVLGLEDDTRYAPSNGYIDGGSLSMTALDAFEHYPQAADSGFPLVLSPSSIRANEVLGYPHQALEWRSGTYDDERQGPLPADGLQWTRHHTPSHRGVCGCGWTAPTTSASCSNPCQAAASQEHLRSPQQDHSRQHLLAVGSRQWGGGGWWDGRGLLRVKIYDFAIYAEPDKAVGAIQNATGRTALQGRRPGHSEPVPRHAQESPVAHNGLQEPAEVLVAPSSGVPMTLVIRACRNLPLQLLSQEFERILQRRHEKAGGRADDPAFRELLSYFSRERLPPHVLTPGSFYRPLDDEAAVQKGAAITFSRSPEGDLVTQAGGLVLGRLASPALTHALFDLYLGDQPVSKRAKAAASGTLQQLAVRGRNACQYRLQAGERLVCPPGASAPVDLSACMVELS